MDVKDVFYKTGLRFLEETVPFLLTSFYQEKLEEEPPDLDMEVLRKAFLERWTLYVPEEPEAIYELSTYCLRLRSNLRLAIVEAYQDAVQVWCEEKGQEHLVPLSVVGSELRYELEYVLDED